MTIPVDFMGMNHISYPVSGASPVGLINWKNVRMSQQPEALWSAIEPNADGNYVWTNLDAVITFHRSHGASVYYGPYGTPTGYANNVTNNPNFTDRVTIGQLGNLGEGAYPTSLTALTNFVTAVMNRYNTPTGAWCLANPTLGKGIQYWETGNEPSMSTLGNGATSSGQQVTSYFWGTPSQLIDFCYTQYAAIKAVDHTVMVSTPGFFADIPNNALASFMSTKGTVNSTKKGSDTCDMVAWHPYQANPPGVIYGTWTSFYGDIIGGRGGVSTWRAWLKQNGYNLPLVISESGIEAAFPFTDTDKAWYASSADFRYSWSAIWLLSCAAQGVVAVHPFQWSQTSNTSGNSGNWQGDTNGVQKAYNLLSTVVGKTISSANYTVGGINKIMSAIFNFSDGTTISISLPYN